MNFLVKKANNLLINKNYSDALIAYRTAFDQSQMDSSLFSANLEFIKRKIGEVQFKEIWNSPQVLSDIKVSVICVTYNHERFIESALKGFVNQKVNFKFEVLIGDDCSSDNTVEIIKKYQKLYPDIIKPIYRKKNIGSIKNWLDLFSRVEGEYVAINDGDDYWIDDQKLQLQANYLDVHKECSICFHPVLVKQELFGKIDNDDFEIYPNKLNDKYNTYDLVSGNFIQTNSVMYRWAFGKNLTSIFNQDAYPSDYYLHILQSTKGEIHSIPRVMSVYLKNATGVFSSISDPKQLLLKYGIPHVNMYAEVLDKVDADSKCLAISKIFEIVSLLVSDALENADFDRLDYLFQWRTTEVCNYLEKRLFIKNIPRDIISLSKYISEANKISVLVTSYNHADYLEQTLESVLEQKGFFNLNVVVCDDFSTDDSFKIIKLYKEKYPSRINVVERTKNVGMLSNMLRGFRLCEGEFTAVCEGDDFWFSPLKLHKQWLILAENPSAMFCFNWSFLKYDNGTCIPHVEQAALADNSFVSTDFIYSNPITANFSSCFYRTTAIKNINPLFYEEKGAADWLFNYLISLEGPGIFLKQLLSVYRIRSSGQWSGMSNIKMQESIARTKSAFHKFNNLIPSFNDAKIELEFVDLKNSNNSLFNIDLRTFVHPFAHLDGWFLNLDYTSLENDKRYLLIADSSGGILMKIRLKNYSRNDVDSSFNSVDKSYVWSGFSVFFQYDQLADGSYSVYCTSYDNSLELSKCLILVQKFEIKNNLLKWSE